MGLVKWSSDGPLAAISGRTTGESGPKKIKQQEKKQKKKKKD